MRKINIEKSRVTNHPTCISYLDAKKRAFNPEDYPWANRFILGFPVPAFQRELKWTEKQMVSFIESIWREYDIGSFMITQYEVAPDGAFKENSDCLIDGQQRLYAIERYWADGFKVLGYFWSDLTKVDHRAFKNIGFGHSLIYTLDELELRETYNRLNFGGVNHDESERA